MPHGLGATWDEAMNRNRICYAAGWYGLPVPRELESGVVPRELESGVNGTKRGYTMFVTSADRASYLLGERHRKEFPDIAPRYFDRNLNPMESRP